GRVLRAAVVLHLAVAESEVVVQVHVHGAAGLPGRGAELDEGEDLVLAGTESQRRELLGLDGAGDTAEEPAHLLLALARPVPRRGAGGAVGGPVDVVGAPVEDRRGVTAPERLVDLPDGRDVVLSAHGSLLVGCASPALTQEGWGRITWA